MKINYFGLLRSPVSWAKIGRELVSVFISVGHDVSVFDRRGFLYDPSYPLPRGFNMSDSFPHDTTLAFEYPANYRHITSKIKCGMLVYETTKAPKEWADKANEHLDLLFLPNEFNRRIFIEAGVKPEIIRVVPHGVNPEIYNSGAGSGKRDAQTKNKNGNDRAPRSTLHASRNRFTFLTVAMPQRRKGIDVLLPAFEKAFDGKKEIELLLKFPYEPGKSKYDIEMPKLPKNVRVITAEYTEDQMAELYCSADCFVLPSRAEGFGLVYLEALACGLPVIATGWGGHTEFLNSKNSLLVEYKLVPAGSVQYDNENACGMMAEPSIDDLVYKMRHMYAYYSKEQEKAAGVELSAFYWDNIAEKMAKAMAGYGCL